MSTSIQPLEVLESGPLKAWRMDWDAHIHGAGYDPALDGGVASWVIQAPWAHPLWHSYWLHIVHLRPIDRGEGPIPTTFYLEGATHELWLYAINPDVALADMVSGALDLNRCLLNPKNFASQLILLDDSAAENLARDTARDVLKMRLNPDTDAIGQWWSRFGDNMRRGPA